MALMQVKVQVDGRQELNRALAGITEIPEDMRPAWELIANDFYSMIQRRFAREGAHEGEPRWRALTPRYARWKLGISATVSSAEHAGGRAGLRRGTPRAGGQVQVGGVAPGAPILHLRSAPSYRGHLSRQPNLRESFVRGRQDNVTRITKRSITMGSAARTPDGRHSLAIIHQRGTRDGRVPPRPPLVLSRATKSRWFRILRLWFTEALIDLRESRGGPIE